MQNGAAPSWIILGRIPRVSAADQLGGDADFSLEFATPPRVSLLTVPPRISPDPVTSNDSPFVLATTSPGYLLLHATQGRRLQVVHLPNNQRMRLQPLAHGYFIFDLAAKTSFRLPEPPRPIGHLHDLGPGVITAPGGDGYMVADIDPNMERDHATLVYFSSETGEWKEKMMDYPIRDRAWGKNGVISHGGRLWWVDLSYGLVTCNPFVDMPVLHPIPLPEQIALPHTSRGPALEKSRCMGVSNGELRFVEIHEARPGLAMSRDDGVDRSCAPMVSTWTLAIPEDRRWELEYEESFADIWAHDSYKDTGLPAEPPLLALIHFKNPAVVYFFMGGCLFGVDVPARKVVVCEAYELAKPSNNALSSRLVRSCELPL